MQAGALVPLSLQLVDSATNKFPRAFIRDASLALVATVDLTHQGNGFYANYSFQMPFSQLIVCQFIVYDDALHTVISTGQSASAQRFDLDGHPVAGDILPLFVQLFDRNTGKFPRANVRDSLGNLIDGSPISLPHISLGLYGVISADMPASNFAASQYLIYDDAGHTIPSPGQGASSDIVLYGKPQIPGGTLFSPATIIATIDSDLQPVNGLQDQINRGSDRTLVVRLISKVNREPFDLSEVNGVEFRFLNEDNTVLSIKESDLSAPIDIVSAEAGKLTCNVTKAQSEVLMIQKPAPFAIVLTGLFGTLVINCPNQLEIAEEAV